MTSNFAKHVILSHTFILWNFLSFYRKNTKNDGDSRFHLLVDVWHFCVCSDKNRHKTCISVAKCSVLTDNVTEGDFGWQASGNDQLVGFAMMTVAAAVFTYYTLWVIVMVCVCTCFFPVPSGARTGPGVTKLLGSCSNFLCHDTVMT